MTERHLTDLETALERAKWRVLEKRDREAREDPAYWTVARPDGSNGFRIVFPDNPELAFQSLRDAYAVEAEVPGHPKAYFARGSSWTKELTEFIDALNAAEFNSIEKTND